MTTMQSPFTYTRTAEPHSLRHVEILSKHPEIRSLYGYDRRTAWVTFAVVPAQIAIAGALSLHLAPWWVVLLAAYFVGSILNHWLAMTIHETSHNLAYPKVWQNKLLALLAGIPCVVPMAMTFHRYHIDHHNYLGVDQDDTDLPLPREAQFIGNSRWKKFIWLAIYMVIYSGRGLFYVKRPDRLELMNIVFQIPFIWALAHFFGGTAIAYLFLSTFFGMSLHPVAAHFIHEHYVFVPGQETYSYYGPLNHVTFNVGYHVEHHDFMNVPGWELPRLHAIASEYYSDRVSHRSWTWVLWHFIMSPGISVANRIVRTREDFEAGRHAVRALRDRKRPPKPHGSGAQSA